MFTSIKNGIRNVGLTLGALALIAGIGAAPSASASSLSSSRLSSTPIVQEQQGKINVVISFSNPSSVRRTATIVVTDRSGQTVDKAVTGTNGQVTFQVNSGAYKVTAFSDGYGTETRVVEVTPNATSGVKILLYSASDR
jgi:hypothetical protein